MDPWEDLASKGVRFVSFGSYNKIWKSSGVVSFILKRKTFDEEEVALLEEATSDVALHENFEKKRIRKKAEDAIYESEK
jgi:hypothetical protein